jgi:hypothetical protein
MKLLKAPEPDSPECALMWVEAPEYWWTWYTLDGKITKEVIGVSKRFQIMIEIRREDEHNKNSRRVG